jgi:hypothetical protein
MEREEEEAPMLQGWQEFAELQQAVSVALLGPSF